MRRQRNRGVLLPIRRELKARLNVFLGEVGEVLNDFCSTHACRHLAQHVADGDAQSANARLPAAFARLNGDDFAVVHKTTGRCHHCRRVTRLITSADDEHGVDAGFFGLGDFRFPLN